MKSQLDTNLLVQMIADAMQIQHGTFFARIFLDHQLHTATKQKDVLSRIHRQEDSSVTVSESLVHEITPHTLVLLISDSSNSSTSGISSKNKNQNQRRDK